MIAWNVKDPEYKTRLNLNNEETVAMKNGENFTHSGMPSLCLT